MNDHAPGPPNSSHHDNQSDNHDRLNGWKEIAAHFGKSVRSVQRWERELGMPVHRLHTPGGEIVFAFRSELGKWENNVERVGALERNAANEEAKNGAEVEEVGEAKEVKEAEEKTSEPALARVANSGKGDRSQRRSRWIAIAAVVVLAALVWAGWQQEKLARAVPVLRKVFASRADRQPAYARVESGVLHTYNARGKLLWPHRFPFLLVDEDYREDRLYRPAYLAVEDLDGDGEREILIVTLGDNQLGSRLVCFNADGKLRFEVQPNRTVQYGSKEYAPPFFVRGFVTTPEPDGTKSIWAIAVHNFKFPSVVWKLDARGNAQAEYWSNGHVTTIQEGRYNGRRVMLVGAMNNERIATTLAALDYDRPSGSAPAENPTYRCENCPAGEPLAYILFPRTEMSREFQSRPEITQIRAKPEGGATLTIVQAFHTPRAEPGVFGADIWYTLDEGLQLVEAEAGGTYRRLHSDPELMAQLKHKFGPRCEAQIFPVLAWNGTIFAELPRPLPAKQPSALSADLARE